MKTSTVLVLVLSAHLVACSSGSSEVPNIIINGPSDDGASVDDGSNLVGQPPENDETPIVGLPPVVSQPPENTAGIQPGELVNLYGRLGFGFGFDESTVVFSFGVDFSAENLGVTDDGIPFLANTTTINTILSPGAEPLMGELTTVGCLFTAVTDQFQCLLDFGGEDQSVFTFGRLVDGFVQGDFEFCDGGPVDDCTVQVLTAPDGPVVVVLGSNPVSSITVTDQTVAADLTPYFQYLEQGSHTSGQRQSRSYQDMDSLVESARRQ